MPFLHWSKQNQNTKYCVCVKIWISGYISLETFVILNDMAVYIINGFVVTTWHRKLGEGHIYAKCDNSTCNIFECHVGPTWFLEISNESR